MNKPQRDTINVELAEIISHKSYPGNQYILRVHAPNIAHQAKAGSFAHIQCAPSLPMRRPISIMRTTPNTGMVDFLYKALGEGTQQLALRKQGETLDILGPIGQPFELHKQYSCPLLIGGGVGMPPMIFIADEIQKQRSAYQPFMILGSEVPFPFTAQPSQFITPGLPADVTASMPLIEDWNIPCRLASLQGYPGCYEGYVTELARLWLSALDTQQRNQVEIFSCGPHPMLKAVAELANEFNLPCQVSLEEFMACAVGGCAGCVVEVKTEQGTAMKRVCVDGPVFDARQVF
ncbi:dihydroorotate dehydrogenase electron transfer subunit [Beggiatoa alba]|nr:dihydroorotate dehydrogenase electron transfer subunit [Beggiatoa alba]